ncbi:uncharacterized protein LOC121760569 [Salvia splendens]|uniref:uncharacterized protein LOC121760569 n=1 Tax=Salvia splendens TaxID=180675 RepID=UPI001C26045D|nr:uncharacterized protein LOC121760569 [Salvia splendens]
MDDLWNDAWDSLIQEVQREAVEEDAVLAAKLVEASLPRAIHHCRTIPRDHSGAHQRLMADYFGDNPRYPSEIFRRCFTLRSDCTGQIGLSTFQKCTAAIRQLAYAGQADMFDEYLQIGSNNDINILQTSSLFNDECARGRVQKSDS